MADAGLLRTTLEAAGFSRVTLQRRNELVSSDGVEAMASVLTRVGPLGRILRENPHLRAAAEARLRAALAEREVRGSVALQAAIWVVAADA